MTNKPIFKFTGGSGWGIPVNTNPNRINPTLGVYLASGPTNPSEQEERSNQFAELNFTTQPGTASGIYYSLLFYLLKLRWNIAKVDEWIDVNPTHREYYERTMGTRQMLEGVIKQGLGSIASAVADYELLSHDLRKYREILNYASSKDKEHSLRAMFIDYVDTHTEQLSMRTFVQRWSTLIADFMRLDDKDVDPDAIAKKLGISKAEGVILATKNRLYIEWKKLFLENVKERYQTILGMSSSRKRSVQEYKEWLKPYIARFKMTKVGLERSSVMGTLSKSFADISGQSNYANKIFIWAWKPFEPHGWKERAKEYLSSEGFVIDPYDDFVRENFILDPKKGLAKEYPYLAEEVMYCENCRKYFDSGIEFCDKCGRTLDSRARADKIVDEEIKPKWKAKEMKLDPAVPYYLLLEINVDRLGVRLQTGELEDITFNTKMRVVSQNIMLVKLLELVCRDNELEKYINIIIGKNIEEKSIEQVAKENYPQLFGKEEKKPTGWKKIRSDFMKMKEEFVGPLRGARELLPESIGLRQYAYKPISKRFLFLKRGPYESNFGERIKKAYLAHSGLVLVSISEFLKQKVGVH